MKTEDEKQLELEIQHIFDSGANEIRVFEMVKHFIKKRFESQQPEQPREHEKRNGYIETLKYHLKSIEEQREQKDSTYLRGQLDSIKYAIEMFDKHGLGDPKPDTSERKICLLCGSNRIIDYPDQTFECMACGNVLGIVKKPDTSQVEHFTNIPIMTTTGEEAMDDGKLIKGQKESSESYVSEKLTYEDSIKRIIELEKRLEHISPLTKKGLPYDKNDESTWDKESPKEQSQPSPVESSAEDIKYVYRFTKKSDVYSFGEIGIINNPRTSPNLWCDYRICEGFWGQEEYCKKIVNILNTSQPKTSQVGMTAEKILTAYFKHNNCSDEFIKAEIERFISCPKCKETAKYSNTKQIDLRGIEDGLMEVFNQNSTDANNGQMSVITEDSYSDTIDGIIEYISTRPDIKTVTDEEIEKWGESQRSNFTSPIEAAHILGLMDGAKAYRDNKIK